MRHFEGKRGLLAALRRRLAHTQSSCEGGCHRYARDADATDAVLGTVIADFERDPALACVFTV
jgi:hypothetical protein